MAEELHFIGKAAQLSEQLGDRHRREDEGLSGLPQNNKLPFRETEEQLL